MSRVTEITQEEENLSEEPVRRGGRDEGEGGGGGPIKLPRLSWGARLGEFYHAIKLEMSKTTWPTRTDVWSTTVVVLLAIIFFGFYLWGVDRVVTFAFEALERAIR